MSVTPDQAITAVFRRAVEEIRRDGIHRDHFEAYINNAWDEATKAERLRLDLSAAADRNGSDDEIQDMTIELYNSCLILATAGLMALAHFPLLELIDTPLPPGAPQCPEI